jgi:hypothetical protein
MSYLLALTGSANATPDDIQDTVDWHLHPERRAIWTNRKIDGIAKGMRLAVKMAGAKVVVLTGTVAVAAPREDPVEDWDGRLLHWRYDVDWDPGRAGLWVPVHELGPPFSENVRTMRFIDRADWLRVYHALHGEDPVPQA